MTTLRSNRILVPGLALLCAIGGCVSGGRLTIESQADPEQAMVDGTFGWGIYRYESHGAVTMLLVDGPVESPRQAVTIRMLWTPRAARTPLDPSATNATIRYVRFDGDEVAVYGGAGYVRPHGRLGSKALDAAVWDADLRLTRATRGFDDSLGPIRLHGRFTIRRDDQELPAALRRLAVRASRLFGTPQFVDAEAQRARPPYLGPAAFRLAAAGR